MSKQKKYTFVIIPDDEQDSWSFNLGKVSLKFIGVLIISLILVSILTILLYLPKLSHFRKIETDYKKLITERLQVFELSKELKRIKQMDQLVRNTLGEKLDIDNEILIEDSTFLVTESFTGNIQN